MQVTVIGQWGGFPKASQATSGYLVEAEGFYLLLDCGSGVISQLQNYIEIEQLNAVLISHYHYDHYIDIGALHYAWLVKTQIGQINKALSIYGHMESSEFEKLTMPPYTLNEGLIEGKRLNIGPFIVTVQRNIHPITSYAVKVEYKNKILVYTGDTAYYEGLVEFARGADLLLCECSLYKEVDGSKMGHMNSLDAGKLAKESLIKHLVLTHLPSYGNQQELLYSAQTIYDEAISVASKGQVYSI